jgi:hypothetical protein
MEKMNLTDLEKMVDDILPQDMLSSADGGVIEKEKRYTNFDDLRKKSMTKAKGVIKKLLSFYLTSDMISDPWTIKKVSTDITNLSNCIWQMDCSQYLITKILEEIDGGATHFQMFKTTADLQKANMEVLKYYKQYVQIIEQEYSEFSANYQTYKQKELEEPKNPKLQGVEEDFTKDLIYETNNTSRGSKSILNAIDKLSKTNLLKESEWSVIDEEVDKENEDV